VRRLALDVAIVDLELPGDSGLDAIGRIKRRCPHIGVLVYTLHDSQAWALQAVRAGATGYLSKAGTPQALTAAVREVAAGRRVLPEGLAAAGQNASPQRLPNPLGQLTPREFEVLRLAVDGLAHADIARALHLSEKTIVNTLSRVRQKLGSPTDFGLMRLLAGQGLTRPWSQATASRHDN
jgi:DNA-binding NarL/FixJ family response regulator